MTAMTDRLGRLVAPVAEELGLSVYDIEDASGTLRVLLDRSGGVDIDALSEASRRISRAMDEDGSFVSTAALEVSSPGLERRLRTAEHLSGAVGERIKVKLRPGVADERRIEGVLTASDATTLTITPDDGDAVTVPIDAVDSARTVFVWAPAPKPGKGTRGGTGSHVSTGAAHSTRNIDETEATP